MKTIERFGASEPAAMEDRFPQSSPTVRGLAPPSWIHRDMRRIQPGTSDYFFACGSKSIKELCW
jgi:hypothetical protein